MKGFSIKTEISEYDTFEQFAVDSQIGPEDLVLCGEHAYNDYIKPLNTGVQTLFREKYSKGEPTDGDVDAILDDTEVLATGHDGKMAVRIVKIGNESLKEKAIKIL